MKTKIHRFSVLLTHQEYSDLRKLAEYSNRPVNNCVESLVRLAVRRHNAGMYSVDMDHLGKVDLTKK